MLQGQTPTSHPQTPCSSARERLLPTGFGTASPNNLHPRRDAQRLLPFRPDDIKPHDQKRNRAQYLRERKMPPGAKMPPAAKGEEGLLLEAFRFFRLLAAGARRPSTALQPARRLRGCALRPQTVGSSL